MSDLLALCYRRNNEAEARRLFADACNSMQRIKSIPLTDRYESDGFLVARFASPFAHAPKVMRFCDDKIILAAAGWYQSKTNRGEKSELAAVAEEYVSGKPEADVFSSLQGQYACTLLDLRQGRLLGWIDRVGLMPGYVTSADGMSWFSTSAIVLASVTKPRLDMHAVRTLFMGRCPNSPRSIFDGITKLGFGEHVELKQGSYKIERTWSPYLATVEYRNLDEAITEGVRKIHACSERVRNSYSRPIMDFTAGLDSRLVVSSFFNGSGERLSVTVSGVPESIDVQIAHLAAKQFGWEIIWMQPNTDGSARRWAAFQRGVALSEGELVETELKAHLV